VRVLLIRPPYTRLKGVGQAPYFPLGLGYIAAVLRKQRFEVKIYHAENPRAKDECVFTDADLGFDHRSNGYHKYKEVIENDSHYIWQEVRETLKWYQPDIVGVSLLSVEVASALKISQLSKQYCDQCYVVWGGVHPTFLPDDCLKNRAVDFVIRGEGEYAMLELCQILKKEKDPTEVKGLSFKRNGTIFHAPNRPPIKNIDEIPFPARDAVLYLESFDFKSLGSMIISRGCPFLCTFCSSRNFWDKKVRFRTSEDIIKEITTLQDEYGTKHVMFWDDSLTINREIVRKYCNAIIDAKLKITWKTATRADLVDENLLKLMKKAGCVKLEIGVESGSDRIKNLIRKDVTNDQIKRSFDLINRIGIGSGAFFMAGFPEETIEDLQQTFQLMKELNATELAFNIFDPMPGSREYEKCIRFGLVPENPNWNNFPFWPDAHYVNKINREDFSNYVNMVAKWLYARNNRLRIKFRRNKRQILFLLTNDPGFLLKKICHLIARRTKVRKLKHQLESPEKEEA